MKCEVSGTLKFLRIFLPDTTIFEISLAFSPVLIHNNAKYIVFEITVLDNLYIADGELVKAG